MATPDDERFWNTLENYDEEIISIFTDAEAARPLVETIRTPWSLTSAQAPAICFLT